MGGLFNLGPLGNLFGFPPETTAVPQTHFFRDLMDYRKDHINLGGSIYYPYEVTQTKEEPKMNVLEFSTLEQANAMALLLPFEKDTTGNVVYPLSYIPDYAPAEAPTVGDLKFYHLKFAKAQGFNVGLLYALKSGYPVTWKSIAYQSYLNQANWKDGEL